MRIDSDFLPYPDVVILLENSKDSIKRFLLDRKRSFEI
jgi:deoxyadenosine/deoxycytidine kinase